MPKVRNTESQQEFELSDKDLKTVMDNPTIGSRLEVLEESEPAPKVKVEK